MGSQLTSTRTLPIPPLIVPNRPRIRTPRRRITTRTRNRNPTTKFRRRAAKAKLATADIQGAGRDVGPLHAPSRVALALVITLRDTAVAAKIRACAAYTDTCCWVSFWKLLCERNWYFLREHLRKGEKMAYSEPQHPAEHPFVSEHDVSSSSSLSCRPCNAACCLRC